MLGAILGIGFAAFFGINSIIVRRGVFHVSVNFIATLTVFSGPIFFFFLTLFTGDLFKISHFTWKALLYFALSGIIHFALGRTFGYRSVQILGSTRSGIMTGLNAIVTLVLAMAVLGEKLTPIMVLGIIFSMSGPILIALKEAEASKKAEAKVNPGIMSLDRKNLYLGLLYGFVAALLWGSSAIFIKLGLDNGGSSLGGSLVAYCAASLAISLSLFNKKNRDEIVKMDWPSLRIGIMSGMSTNLAQMLRYIALAYGTVIVVSFASRTIPLWVLLFSFIFNRKIESFSRWVFIGNGLLMLGTILVLL